MLMTNQGPSISLMTNEGPTIAFMINQGPTITLMINEGPIRVKCNTDDWPRQLRPKYTTND